MEIKTEEEPEKKELKGARKRKCAAITRIIQNVEPPEPILKRLLPQTIETNTHHLYDRLSGKIEPTIYNKIDKRVPVIGTSPIERNIYKKEDHLTIKDDKRLIETRNKLDEKLTETNSINQAENVEMAQQFDIVKILQRLSQTGLKQTSLRNEPIQPTIPMNSNETSVVVKKENIPHVPLKEPEQRVTLIERALGSFNASTDIVALNNPLNTSITTGPPFTCNICKSWFYMGGKLKLHYIVNHKCFHCDICCSLFYTESERDDHIQNMHNTVQCEICQDELGRHDIWFHYDQDHDAVACTFCGIILRPKSTFAEHFLLGHKISMEYTEHLADSTIAVVKPGDKNFYCSLCAKYRSLEVFFGHMKSFHKISTTQFLNIMHKEQIDINIDGTTVSERTANESGNVEEIVPIQNTGRVKLSCDVCQLMYNDKIHAGFHNVYCQLKVQCLYCNSYFENEIRRKRHMKRNHNIFLCTNGCDYNCDSEDKIDDHNLSYHSILNCRYCDFAFTPEKLDEHLLNTHKYKANIMKNFTETLFEVTEFENQHIVICCLCEDNITVLVDDITQVFDHFSVEHKVSMKKLLRLLSPKPSIADYEDFYKEIDKSIDSENSEFTDEDKTISDDESQEMSNKENELLNKDEKGVKKKEKDVSNVKIECDIDTQEVEGVLDVDIESDTQLKCEFCNIENINILDLLIHLKDKHRLVTKYNEHECKVCTEILLSDQSLNRHELSHDVSDDSTELYDCGCEVKVLKCLAREHLVDTHGSELERHDVSAVGLKCRFCDSCFWERTHVNDHEVSYHSSDNESSFLKCPVCFYSFSDQNCLKSHSETFHEDYPRFSPLSYKCSLCFFLFPTVSLLREHFSSLHSTLKLYRCPHPGCHKLYKVAKYVRMHLNSPHKAARPERFEVEPCGVCGIRLGSCRAHNVHMMVKHRKMGFMCRICKERFQTVEQRKLHCATSHPGELSYACRECGKGFVSKSGLYGHRKTHVTNNTSITCPYCSKEFSRRDSYGEHLLIHVGPKHQCPHCPKLFTQRSNLIRHVRIHTGTKPYACCYCDKRFSDQGAKRSHERVHTKEEHCECTECGKKFTKWQKLKYHMKLHTGIGLLTCEVCSKKFTNNYSLNEHKRTHETQTLVMCECGRGFSSEKYLMRHQQNVHAKGPPKFTCPICFKQLYRRKGFNDHMMSHTGTKEYVVSCLICNKKCYSKRTVRRHILQKHKVEEKDIDNFIQQLKPESPDKPVNLTDLLDEENMLQVDLMELETLNNDDTSEVKIKSEPVSEDDDEEDDDDDEDYVETNKKKVRAPVRCSPRNKKNPKRYSTDSFSDEEC